LFGLFPMISEAFFDWRSAETVLKHRKSCREKALKVFNHPRKISAIIDTCRQVAMAGFEKFKHLIETGGVDFLGRLDFIGPVTRYHLAKNIGLDVAKPDRHLARVASAADFDSPDDLCRAIADDTGDRVSVVDLVIWRYATIEPGYVRHFSVSV